MADLAARRTELEGQREQIERELERRGNREAELERLEAEQAQIEDRIREGWGGLDDASPEKRREVYEDLRLRVEATVPHRLVPHRGRDHGLRGGTRAAPPLQRGETAAPPC